MSPTQIKRLSLKKNKDLFLVGKKFYGTHFTVIFVPAPSTGFATLVSKKIAKLAVNRNKIRRRVAYLLRKNAASLTSGNYLLLPKNTVLKSQFSEISSDLSTLIDRISKSLGV